MIPPASQAPSLRPRARELPTGQTTWVARASVAGRAAAVAVAILVSPTALARSPRTGDLATVFAVGVDAPVNHDAFDADAVFSIAQEFYWSGANAVRGTIGNLSLQAADGSGRGRFSARYLTAGMSHNWLRGRVFPYITGGLGIYAVEQSAAGGRSRDSLEAGVSAGAGVEFRLKEVVTLRLEGLVHALTGDGPTTVATGALGVAFYY